MRISIRVKNPFEVKKLNFAPRTFHTTARCLFAFSTLTTISAAETLGYTYLNEFRDNGKWLFSGNENPRTIAVFFFFFFLFLPFFFP